MEGRSGWQQLMGWFPPERRTLTLGYEPIVWCTGLRAKVHHFSFRAVGMKKLNNSINKSQHPRSRGLKRARSKMESIINNWFITKFFFVVQTVIGVVLLSWFFFTL